MKSKLVALAAASTVLFVFACQKATPPGFVKYKSEGDVPRVSVQDAKAEIDGGTAIMVDARPADAYNQEHVTGSTNIPLDSPPEKYKDLPQGKKIFIYCS
ncbi:MAG TPA: rhodanese-like domain-containing protein [Pyrinomonadaceae bacterium]